MNNINKSTIKRSDFKKTLIDQVTIKVDFPGAIINLSDIIKGIRVNLSEFGYKNFIKGRIGKGQINVNFDPDKLPDISVSSDDSENYVFKHESGLYEIHVNEYYLFFIAKLNKKMIKFDEYVEVVYKTINLIKIYNGDYLPIARIGLRKINMLLSDNEEIGYKNFESSVFPKGVLSKYFDSREIGRFEDKYIKEEGNVNFVRLTDKGIELIDNEEHEKVRFVIDIGSYLEKSVNNMALLNEASKTEFLKNLKDTFTSLNNLCYEFFVASCNVDYLKELT